jgi:hypothetical protein
VSDDLTLRRDVLVHLDSDLFTAGIFELVKLALNSVVLGGVVASVLVVGAERVQSRPVTMEF